jgi:PAS domain S-box-containing protein
MRERTATGPRNRVLVLVSKRRNRQLLADWIAQHPQYESVDATGTVEETEFDVCILDKGTLRDHVSALRAKKSAAAPVVLPYLLLLPESDRGIVDLDAGELVDNVVTETVDEIVSMPIRKAELHWRLNALLRLRTQSLTLRERERELERQVDLFEKAQDIAKVGAWEYDVRTDEGWWTDEVRRIHGLPADVTPSPEASLQHYHEDDRPRIEAAFEAAVAEGEPYDLELRFVDAEGTERWVRTRGEPHYEDGDLTRVRGTIQDITERKERELDRQRIQRAVEASGRAIYVTDPAGRIEYVNPAFEETTGFAREEVLGETPDVLNSGEMPDEYFERLWETIRAGDVWEEEIVNRRADGETYTAMQTIAPVTDSDEIHAFVAIQNDITERKRREEELERRTRAIDEAPVGITISDPERDDNPLIYANDAFVDITGYPRSEALGRNCRFLQGENTDPRQVARLRQAIDAQEPISIELQNYRKDGSAFWNHLEIAPVEDDAGEVRNYIGFQQDVTARRERQQQLAVIDRVLRHNLRNDMNVIHGWGETIRSETTGAVAEAAEQIMEVSDELLELAEKERAITDLLLEEPRLDAIEVGDLLRRVASDLGSEYPAATVTVECPDGVTVRATPQFERAVEELVRNGIVHNDAASPEVALTVTDTGGTVSIDVADDGPLIPEVERAILEEDVKQTPLYHGSGLGLWFVKLLTTRSGGTIAVGENDPRGNVVSIEFQR